MICGAGVNVPLALTAEPAMVIALPDNDRPVSTYSRAVLADAASVTMARIAAEPL